MLQGGAPLGALRSGISALIKDARGSTCTLSTTGEQSRSQELHLHQTPSPSLLNQEKEICCFQVMHFLYLHQHPNQVPQLAWASRIIYLCLFYFGKHKVKNVKTDASVVA